MIATNVAGLMRITRLCLPHIRDGGHIVNMGSIAGRQAYPNGASYVASKFAVRGFTLRAPRGPARPADPDHDGRRRASSRPSSRVVRFRGDEEEAKSVYEGSSRVTADEVADCVLFALTRPPHVNIDEIVVKALAQSSGARIVRKSGK